MTLHIDDADFDKKVLKASGTVLVDFWAEWCSPCKQLGPILDDLAKEMEGKVTIAKLNIENNPLTPQKYSVRGIPTMIIFKDGKQVATKVGGLPKNELIKWLASVA